MSDNIKSTEVEEFSSKNKKTVRLDLQKINNQKPDLMDLDKELKIKDCNVTVMSGTASKEFPMANQKVGDIRKILKGVLNIADNAVPLVNGEVVSEEHIVNAKERLEFVKRAGHKGVWKISLI